MPQHDPITPRCKEIRNLQIKDKRNVETWYKPDIYVIIMAAYVKDFPVEGKTEALAMRALFQAYASRYRAN